MAFAITQTCCNDATCVSVCPVNCIHPTPQEREFGSTDQLHIDPRTCIDCGACADACPVDAIFPVDQLVGAQREYAEVNAAWYADRDPGLSEEGPNFHAWEQPTFDRTISADFPRLRVAVVGTGPAGMYAAEDLLLHTQSRVTLVDRLDTPGGLVRYGVAPDHPSTRRVGETFERLHEHPRLRRHLGLEVGEDLTHEELLAHHDAVVYAVGASADRRLGVPGEDLPGCSPATRLVGWYNDHPDVAADAVVPDAERVVVVGTGNVAVDVARVLTTDPDDLAGTEVAPHALEALRAGRVREVVLLGRRGPEHAAYTLPEVRALKHLEGVDLVVDEHDPAIGEAIDAASEATPSEKAAVLQGVPREKIDWSTPPPEGGRRIVLRFGSQPEELCGTDRVEAVRTTEGGGTTTIPTGLVVTAIGHRGTGIPGLPFDPERGTVPHEHGRVIGSPGAYVVGWVKRGPSGGIGANRVCARETVGTLLADAAAGRLPRRRRSTRSFRRLAKRRAGQTSEREMATLDG